LENKWKLKCDESASEYASGKIKLEDNEDAVLYHPETLEDAIFIREYMEKTYPEIDIAILIKGFMYYSKTMKNMSKEWYK
jgi:hypothetical protein